MKTKAVKRRISASRHPPAKLWQLRLYVMDETPKSVTALSNLTRICETHLKGRYRITVIDLLKQPKLAKGDQILAIPMIRRHSLALANDTTTTSLGTLTGAALPNRSFGDRRNLGSTGRCVAGSDAISWRSVEQVAISGLTPSTCLQAPFRRAVRA